MPNMQEHQVCDSLFRNFKCYKLIQCKGVKRQHEVNQGAANKSDDQLMIKFGG